MYEHVERYLVGALNEPALEAWRLRVGKGLAEGRSLDEVIRTFCEVAEVADALAHALERFKGWADKWANEARSANTLRATEQYREMTSALAAYRAMNAPAPPERSEGASR